MYRGAPHTHTHTHPSRPGRSLPNRILFAAHTVCAGATSIPRTDSEQRISRDDNDDDDDGGEGGGSAWGGWAWGWWGEWGWEVEVTDVLAALMVVAFLLQICVSSWLNAHIFESESTTLAASQNAVLMGVDWFCGYGLVS